MSSNERHISQSEYLAIAEEVKRLRIDFKLSQEDIGRIIGLSARNVSYIESGSRLIKRDEISLLKKKFPTFLKHENSPETLNFGNVFLDESNFFKKQQDHFNKYKNEYVMWIFNMMNIHLMNSTYIEETWADNIVQGINYSVIWNLNDYLNGSSQPFNDFIRTAVRIVDKVNENVGKKIIRNDQSSLNEEIACGIDVYGFYDSRKIKDIVDVESKLQALNNEFDMNIPLEVGSNLKSFLGDFLRAGKTYTEKELENTGLRFHIPFDEYEFQRYNAQHPLIFTHSAIYKGGIVIYRPRFPEIEITKGAPMMAILELNESCRDFNDKSINNPGHIFLGENVANYYVRGISEFLKWYNQKYKFEETSTIISGSYLNSIEFESKHDRKWMKYFCN